MCAGAKPFCSMVGTTMERERRAVSDVSELF